MSCVSVGVGRVGGILGPYVIGLLQQATGGPDAVFWAIGGAAIVGAFAIGSLGLATVPRHATVDGAPAE